jgi:hypothetical protein
VFSVAQPDYASGTGLFFEFPLFRVEVDCHCYAGGADLRAVVEGGSGRHDVYPVDTDVPNLVPYATWIPRVDGDYHMDVWSLDTAALVLQVNDRLIPNPEPSYVVWIIGILAAWHWRITNSAAKTETEMATNVQ